jgi:mycothiol synthase
MQTPVVPDLVRVRVDSDADLEAMISVRAEADPHLPPPRIENLRHNLASDPELTYLVARLGGRPVGCGFVEISPARTVTAHLVVIPSARRRGVGSRLLAEASTRARARHKTALQGEVREDDAESRGYFERRGYSQVGGEQAVALELALTEAAPVEPPAGVRVLSRAERPDVLEGLYAVSLDAERDIPDHAGARSFEAWCAHEIERPTRRPELAFIAFAGEEVIGYASLDDFGEDAYHGLTAVKRAWRRRGVATALKRALIAAARDRGHRRLVTESETRNVPMRSLNEKLGYRPAPELSVVVLRGPLL